MGFPYTDVASHYPTGPLAGNLIDAEPSPKNIAEVNSVAVASGGAPSGNGTYRGPISRAGGASGWFNTSLQFGSVYDVRGLTSHAMLCWIRLNETVSEPLILSLWNIVAANHEGWTLIGNSGAAPRVPAFRQYDGLSQGNFIQVKAATSGTITATAWHLIGGGFNAVTKKIMCFWGDGDTGATHYQEADGFAAGYGPLIDVANVNVGKFSAFDTLRFDIDLLSHWKRAFDEQDFLNHWQLGTGLARSEFAVDPGRGTPAAMGLGAALYYYY